MNSLLNVVQITGVENISPSNNGGGQPWVVANDGALNQLTFSLVSGYTFNEISFNLVPLNARGNTPWTATITGTSPNGSLTQSFDITGNTTFDAYTTDGWTFSSVSFATDTALQGVGQIRIGGLTAAAAVPEPASWAFFIAGFGGLGAALRRRHRISTSLV